MTPTLNSGFNACFPRIADVMDVFGKNAPFGRDHESVGVLNFLLSQANTAGFTRVRDLIQSGKDGKTVKITLRSPQPYCFSVMANPYSCNEEATPFTPATQYFDYELSSRWVPKASDGKPQELKIAYADYVQNCELEHTEVFRNEIINYDNRFVKMLNKELMSAMFNSIDATQALKNIPLTVSNANTGQSVVNDEWFVFLTRIVEEAGMNIEDYVMLGGLFIKKLEAKGVDIQLPYFYDRNFDSVFGASFLLMPKGSFQFVDYNFYEGARAQNTELFIAGTKVLPLNEGGSSITLDYRWEYEPKCESYVYMPSKYAELIKAIPGSCLDEDTDGIFLIKDCNNAPVPVC